VRQTVWKSSAISQSDNMSKYGTAIIVQNPDETGLYLSERLGEHGTGKWACPGGMLNEGENIIEGAARELKEETGIVRATGNFKYLRTTANAGQKSDFTHWVVTKLMPGETPKVIEPEKHKHWEFFTYDQALSKPLWLSTDSVVKDLKNGFWNNPFEQLKRRVEELEAAIRKHREATGHNMCWENDEELWAVLADGVVLDHTAPEHCEFFRKCIEYRESKDKHESTKSNISSVDTAGSASENSNK
jgi:8-oxo-dGTP diphosphatase